jgi:hypothetical protein
MCWCGSPHWKQNQQQVPPPFELDFPRQDMETFQKFYLAKIVEPTSLASFEMKLEEWISTAAS